jgi:hypothetical protein
VVNFVDDLKLYLSTCSVPQAYGASKWDDNAASTFVATTIKRLRKPETYKRLLKHPEESSVPQKIINFIKDYVNNHPILLKAQTHDAFKQLAYELNVKLLKGKLNDIREAYAGLPREDEPKSRCIIL